MTPTRTHTLPLHEAPAPFSPYPQSASDDRVFLTDINLDLDSCMSVSEGVHKDGNSYVPVPNQMATQIRFQEKKSKTEFISKA